MQEGGCVEYHQSVQRELAAQGNFREQFVIGDLSAGLSQGPTGGLAH